VSYYPYLINDKETLIKEAQICESYARNLTPLSEKQSLLKQENLFPMLESMSRIYFHLGEHDHSLQLMKEIVVELDSYDAKAWMQFGGLNEQMGNIEEAKKAYQKACSLGAPLGGISWYRLGRVFEKLQEIENAQFCYFRSLKFGPKGISPLKRIRELTKDQYIHDWSNKLLECLLLDD